MTMTMCLSDCLTFVSSHSQEWKHRSSVVSHAAHAKCSDVFKRQRRAVQKRRQGCIHWQDNNNVQTESSIAEGKC